MNQQKNNRGNTKLYEGIYVAEVMSVDDPDKQCRVKVNVYDIFDGVSTDDLPWAMTLLPFGARNNDGALVPVQVGDLVAVQFFSGDTRRPVIVGSMHATPDGKPDITHDVWQGGDKMVHKRADHEPEVPDPPYYEDSVFKQNGALLQATREGHIRVTQLDTASAIEITEEGNIVLHCEKSILGSAVETILIKIGKSTLLMEPEKIEWSVLGASTITMTPDSIALNAPRIDIN